ncbi:MAG: hypothetical protein AB7N76_34885 [Planctomycetota bacterium]
MSRAFAVAALLALSCGGWPAGAGVAWAQDDDDDEGVGPAPLEARAVVARAVKALGGKEALEAVRTATLLIDPKDGPIRERHVLRVEGRVMHYASRRKSGAGFDVVVGGGQAFLCDRDAKGVATFVEDLNEKDTCEGAYERDILFLPLLLLGLLEDKDAKMDYRGRNSKGHEVIRARISPPPGAKHERPFTIRIQIDKDTNLPVAAMGIVPLGQDKGKKRYCEYQDYAEVSVGRGKVRLPRTIHDQRGKGLPSRTFQVRWQLNPELPPSLFVRPQVARDKD